MITPRQQSRGVNLGVVETRGESRTLKIAPSVVDALRNLSGALARLTDTLDEAGSNSLGL